LKEEDVFVEVEEVLLVVDDGMAEEVEDDRRAEVVDGEE